LKKYFALIVVFLTAISSFLSAQEVNTEIPIPEKKYIKYLDFRFENGAMLSNGTDLGDQIVNSSYYNAIDLRLGFQKTDPLRCLWQFVQKTYYGSWLVYIYLSQ